MQKITYRKLLIRLKWMASKDHFLIATVGVIFMVRAWAVLRENRKKFLSVFCTIQTTGINSIGDPVNRRCFVSLLEPLRKIFRCTGLCVLVHENKLDFVLENCPNTK